MKDQRVFKDRYGFWFWLRWILWFAGSFILSAVIWTFLLRKIFTDIIGPELTITWCIAVFGTWFLLVIPFMRKKEQIWKRLNEDQERSVDAWFQGMSIFIGFLIATCFFWSVTMKEVVNIEGLDRSWTRRVFVTWMVVLIPFLIYMYRQADAIFKRANERQTYSPNYRSVYIELEKRILSDHLQAKLKKIPTTLPHSHVVDAILKNGQTIKYVFIKNSKEIAGIYDQENMSFAVQDILDLKSIPTDKLPVFVESKWLRMDISKEA